MLSYRSLFRYKAPDTPFAYVYIYIYLLMLSDCGRVPSSGTLPELHLAEQSYLLAFHCLPFSYVLLLHAPVVLHCEYCLSVWSICSLHLSRGNMASPTQSLAHIQCIQNQKTKSIDFNWVIQACVFVTNPSRKIERKLLECTYLDHTNLVLISIHELVELVIIVHAG